MAERYTSLVALILDRPLDDVGAVVRTAVAAGDIDRQSAVRDPVEAAEVVWGGRMQRAVVRRVEGDGGEPLLRTEAYVGGEGIRVGLRRQAELLRGLARHVAPAAVTGVVDLSSGEPHDLAWLERVASDGATHDDAIIVHTEGTGTHWTHSHGAARFDVPDLELYGLPKARIEGAARAIRHVHEQLLAVGLRGDLTLPDGTPVFLVPVLESWQRLPLDWPGIGRAGQTRPGHDGPRATLSILGKPRLGRYPRDLKGVLPHL